jgi:hypothetical protein
MPSPCSRVNPAPASRMWPTPGYLLRPHQAVEKVNSGAIPPRVTAGRRQHRFEHFSPSLAMNLKDGKCCAPLALKLLQTLAIAVTAKNSALPK